MSDHQPFALVRKTTGTVYRTQSILRTSQQVEPSILAMAIGGKVEALRKQHGLTQQELGAAIGCDRSAVCRWEAGNRLPTLEHLVALGQVLGCSARALLPEEQG